MLCSGSHQPSAGAVVSSGAQILFQAHSVCCQNSVLLVVCLYFLLSRWLSARVALSLGRRPSGPSCAAPTGSAQRGSLPPSLGPAGQISLVSQLRWNPMQHSRVTGETSHHIPKSCFHKRRGLVRTCVPEGGPFRILTILPTILLSAPFSPLSAFFRDLISMYFLPLEKCKSYSRRGILLSKGNLE